MAKRDDNRPILVTGGHRSGTTFVGKLLAASGEVTYVHEPFNPLSASVGGVLPPFERGFEYICRDNAGAYRSRVADVFQLRYRPIRRLAVTRARIDLPGAMRAYGSFMRGRALRKRVLVKDPIALFSAPWLQETFGARIVVMIRHPAGFVSSVVRLGWNFKFSDWLSQDLLMRDYLAPLKDDIAAQVHDPGDSVERGIVLWNGIHLAIARMRDEHPEWSFVRHEDISHSPFAGFERLYEEIGLTWSPEAREAVVAATRPSNPSDIPASQPHVIARDSATTAEIWRQRLSPSDVERIVAGTREIAAAFYTPEELEP